MTRRTAWLGVLLLCLFLALLFVGLILIPEWLYPSLGTAQLRGVSSQQARVQLQQAQGQLANSVRSSVLQVLAGLAVVGGAIATWRQVHISREGQITERFTRAVDQLGNQNVDVRVGGLYALERIARDSVADRTAIQFLMGAFVRNHANWPISAPDSPQRPAEPVDDRLPSLRARAADVQVAMAILGRRLPSPDQRPLTLSRVDLRGLSLNGAHLNGAAFQQANLAHAELINVRLDNADLTAADLRQSCLIGSHLTRANLSRANLGKADLRGADLSGAILEDTVLTDAQADTSTIWPADFNVQRRRELGVIEADDNLA
jgi:Pentapeptide repeats (8 copies)